MKPGSEIDFWTHFALGLTSPTVTPTFSTLTQRRPRSSKTAPKTSNALSYTNRMGSTYYLLTAMPEGYEFSESINGVVSVRRVSTGRAAPKIPDTDLAMCH